MLQSYAEIPKKVILSVPNIFVLLSDVKNISDALECLEFGALTSLSIDTNTDLNKKKNEKIYFLCETDNLNYKK